MSISGKKIRERTARYLGEAYMPEKLALIVRRPALKDAPRMKALWKQAFGDEDKTIEDFFRVAFSPERSLCAYLEGEPVGMLYWFDYRWGEKLVAYVYGVATDAQHRKKGICERMMQRLKKNLRKAGYAGAILVPANKHLFHYYHRFGFNNCAGIEHYSLPAAGEPDPGLRQITWQEYARLRPYLLPEGGLTPDEAAFRYLDTYARFFRADAGIFCGAYADDEFRLEEFLGDSRGLFAIFSALGCQVGKARLQGDAPFAMYCSFTQEEERPLYLGVALD